MRIGLACKKCVLVSPEKKASPIMAPRLTESLGVVSSLNVHAITVQQQANYAKMSREPIMKPMVLLSGLTNLIVKRIPKACATRKVPTLMQPVHIISLTTVSLSTSV